MTRILLLILLLGGRIPAAYTQTNAEAQIQYLIRAVAESGCEFDRNGERYPADKAAEHLELKYARGKGYADSPEAFIEHLASNSSWTGEPYLMICGAEVTPAGEWLMTKLEAIAPR